MKRARQIPEFKSAEEEAAFWEKHSVAPYWDQLEPVQFKITRPRKKQVSIRFDPNILEQVRAVAEKKGIPYQTLVQMWVAEKLQEVRKPSSREE